jgi:hypothetical protein
MDGISEDAGDFRPLRSMNGNFAQVLARPSAGVVPSRIIFHREENAVRTMRRDAAAP